MADPMTTGITLSALDLVPVYGSVSSTEALRQAAELAQTVERLGYRRYWAAEHHDLPGLACASPEVLLAHIGAKTSSIRLGTGALLLPHYKPLKVAESFHMLASLYPGRIDLGMGRAPGGSAQTSMALSGNFLANVQRIPELLEDVTQLLQGTYTYEGERVRAQPAPPEPPELWLLGTNEKSAAYAAQFGTGYVFGHFMSDTDGAAVIRSYRERFIPSPLHREPRTIAAVSVICAETESEARALAETAERGSPERKPIVGTPRQAAAQLRRMAAEYETEEWMIATMIPDYRKRLQSYALLAAALGQHSVK